MGTTTLHHDRRRLRRLGPAVLAWVSVGAIVALAATVSGAPTPVGSPAHAARSATAGSATAGSAPPVAAAAGSSFVTSSSRLEASATGREASADRLLDLAASLPPASIPLVDWAVPGTVIRNLDTAPGSPYGPGARVVALTFDDGPNPVFTPQVLAVLVARHVFASFEIVGVHGAAAPALLRQEFADGMVLVNHTWSHVDLAALSPAALAAQVDPTDALLQGVTGHPVRCLRPPSGETDRAVLGALGTRGLAELIWDVDPSDYLRPPAAVLAQRVLAALHPGAIVVLHDSGGDRSQTVAALPAIIDGIEAAGYQIVPVCGG